VQVNATSITNSDLAIKAPSQSTYSNLTPEDSLLISKRLAVPTLIVSYNASDLQTTQDVPISDFFQIPSVERLLANQYYISATVNLRCSVTASPYALGLSVMTYVPYMQYTDYDQTNEFNGIVSAQNAAIIDYSRDSLVDYSFPLVTLNTYAISSELATTVDVVKLLPTSTLINVDDSEFDGEMHIHMWLTDVKIFGKILIDLESKMEYNGLVSAPASAIAAMAGTAKRFRSIKKLATAVEIGAGAVASISHLFGFSRPNQPLPSDHLNYGIGGVNVNVNSYDANRGVTVDPGVDGVTTEDQLSLSAIVQRWGYIGTYLWSTTQASHAEISVIPVTPFFTNTATGSTTPTPILHASIPFRYWAGGIRYKLVIPANRFVKGKLRLWWGAAASSSVSAANITANSHSLVVDVAATTVVEFHVPWTRNDGYLEANGISNLAFHANNPNGFLHMMVEEPLRGPGGTVLAIPMLLFISGDTDFRLAAPNPLRMSQMQLRTKAYLDTLTPATAEQFWARGGEYDPTPKLAPAVYAAKTNSTVFLEASLQTDSVFTVEGANTSTHPIIYMGEDYMSLRPLMKSFSPYTTATTLTGAGPNEAYTFSLGRDPMPGGNLVGLTGAPPGSTGIMSNIAAWTYHTWFRLPFLVNRGSTRYAFKRLSPIQAGSVTAQYSTLQSVYEPAGYRMNGEYLTTAPPTGDYTLTDNIGAILSYNGISPALVNDNIIDKISVFEVPYMSTTLVEPQIYFGSPLDRVPSVRITHKGNSGVGVIFEVSEAMGEDGSPLGYWYPPTINYVTYKH
jgi:hypothetical protein